MSTPQQKIAIEFTPEELSAYLGLLERAGDQLSNNGCNDWQIPNTLANWQFYMEIAADNHDMTVEEYLASAYYLEEGDPPKSQDEIYLMDWIVLDYLQRRIEKAVKLAAPPERGYD